MVQFIVQFCIYFWLAFTNASDSNALSYVPNAAKAEPELCLTPSATLTESLITRASEWQFLFNSTGFRRSIRRTEDFLNPFFFNVTTANIFFKGFFKSVFKTQQEKSIPSLKFVKLLNGCYAALYRFHLF